MIPILCLLAPGKGQRRVGSRAQRRLAREQAAATWGQAVAGTAHTLAAYFHDRLHTIALNGETTVTIPALRDVQAELGDGEPLRDTDPAWRARHATAMERTQPIPPEVQAVAIAVSSATGAMTDPALPPDPSPGDWIDTRRDDWQPKSNPGGGRTQGFAAPGPARIDAARVHAVAVPHGTTAAPARWSAMPRPRLTFTPAWAAQFGPDRCPVCERTFEDCRCVGTTPHGGHA